MEGPLKVTGDLSVVGLLSTAIGLTCLLAFQFTKEKTRWLVLLKVSLAGFAMAFLFLFASWMKFQGARGNDASCIVESERGTGAVWAHGRFDEIFKTGAYAYPFVIGAWLLLLVPMLLIFLRIHNKSIVVDGSPKEAPEQDSMPEEASVQESTPKEADV